jgi:two-component system, NtrC family, sensor histidine kinase HydH
MDKISKQKYLRIGIVALLVLIITVLHFKTSTERPYLHQIYQRSYYIPIVLAGYWFEILGGLATASCLAVLFITHILHDWSHHPDYAFQQYAEIPMYLVIALLVGYLSRYQRRSRENLERARSQLAEAYKKLNDAFDQLRHADRLALLGQLSAGIAHEIRNPLASIQGAVDILGQGMSAEDPKLEFAHIARKEVARLERLTTEILQFSKPAPPQKLNADPREIVQAACRLVADQAHRQGIDIILHFDESDTAILVDPEQIKQVLINIFINAIQAQTKGGRIAITAKAEGGEWIAIVQDSGPGISSEQLEHIFDPFFTTKREGTGLGLSISYQLVINNGGRIRASSKPGEGARFEISFPAV